MAQSKGSTSLGVVLPENREPASFWNVILGQVPKKKIVSVNFIHALFSLLDFLTLEDGIDWSFQNISKELPLNTM